MNRLNGWQRLWVLTVLVWATVVFFQTAETMPRPRSIPRTTATGEADLSTIELRRNPERDRVAHAIGGVVLWTVTSAGLYAFGYGVDWVRRGFRQQR